MNFLEAIEFILTAHYQARIVYDGIHRLLLDLDIDLPEFFVQDIMLTLYHPVRVEEGIIYNVEYCMRAFIFIMQDFAAGNTNQGISVRLYQMGYAWSPWFVEEILQALFVWYEFENGNSS